MKPELEALILACEAVQQAENKESEQPNKAFEALLNETLDKNPGLSRSTLLRAITLAHKKWADAQLRKPPSMPPTA